LALGRHAVEHFAVSKLCGLELSVSDDNVRFVDDTSKTRTTIGAYVYRTEQRDWAALAELLDDHLVYEIPQTRERVHGKAAFLQFNREYPGDWHLELRRFVADGRHGAAWIDSRVGDQHQDACVWFELSEHGLINRITDFWPDPYEPPGGREHLVERW
jgi:SnoaL-like domain